MKIVKIAGGLANQMFQYIFYRCLEKHSNDLCYLNDSFYVNHKAHNGMELDKIFNINPRWFRDEFTQDEWLELAKIDGTRTFPEKIRTLGLNANIATEASSFLTVNLFDASSGEEHIREIPFSDMRLDIPRIIRLKGNFYFFGTWACKNIFNTVRDEILNDFTFPPFDDDGNKAMATHIERTNSIGIHVRRGDFVRNGWNVDAQRYVSSVRKMKYAIINPTFFIFSDDISWCRENIAGMSLGGKDDVVFVDINQGASNFRDMQLMSLCKNLIRAPSSSFSLMAGMLNRNPDKIIAYPSV